MANYNTEMQGKFIRGNFGVRVVSTEVTSIGFRSAFEVIEGELGTLTLVEDDSIVERIEGGGSYTEVLPSANFVMDYSDDILLRAGIYRGMSRADPSDLGYSRTFQTDDEVAPTTISDLIVGVTAKY